MENKKILIVDDDDDLTEAIKAALEAQQYTVFTAADRMEGMEKIKAEKPDLAILDVMISSWQDGFEMARELKSDALYKDMPILMLTSIKNKTGIDFKTTAGESHWCPVDGFLDKPADSEMLLAEVKRLLQK
ncbi:MAG: response regulator transcription factor [Planctomycetota bacterium]|jgi:DNA-binding response OmpR family regulator